MNKIIFFDIDKTLFNTPFFAQKTEEQLAKLISVSKESISDTIKVYSKTLKKYTDLRPSSFLQIIADTHTIDYKKIHNFFFHTPSLYVESLYPDTRETIETLFKKGFRLGIFSEGGTYFQRKKIQNSGLWEYFDKDIVFICKRKLTRKILNSVPSSIIVDDNIEVIDNLLKYRHFTPIHISREKNDPHPIAKSIHSLKELLNIE